MKSQSEIDHKSISAYLAKNGGTVRDAAKKTGASLHNYGYWNVKLKKMAKKEAKQTKVKTKSRKAYECIESSSSDALSPQAAMPGKAVVIMGSSEQIRQILGGLN